MAAQEKLVLEAELKNKMSAELKKILQDLEALGGTSAVMKQTVGWLKDVSKGAEEFVASGAKAGVVINAMGIGGLTAAASLAEMVKQMKDMGERTLAMKELGREVGLTIDQVNAFAHAGQHFGVSGEAMSSALDHLAGQMPEFRRNLGPLMQELGRWPELIKKLQKEGTSDQIKDIFEFLGKAEIQREPQLQKKLFDAFFGNGADMEKLMAQGAKGFLDEVEKQRKSLGSISPEMLKQAQAFRDAQIGLNDAIERFENSVGPKFLAMMTHIVDDMRLVLGGPTPAEQAALDKKEQERRKAFRDSHAQQKIDDDKRQRVGGAADERSALKPLTKDEQERIDRALRTPTPSLLHKSAFFDTPRQIDPLGTGLEGAVAAGTKQGFLAALREMAAGQDAGKPSGGDGGITNASFTGDSRSGDYGDGQGGTVGRRRSPSRGRVDENIDPSESVPSFGKSSKTFVGKAPMIMDRLKKDFGLTTEEAGAVLGNLGHESQGFKAFAELGGGPGRGWAQWTDPGRKRRFFEFAEKHHLDPKSDEANYGFLKWELTHTHKKALEALRAAHGVDAQGHSNKMTAFERIFEGAGVKAYGSRERYMREALRAYAETPRRAEGLAGAGATSAPVTNGHVEAHVHVHGDHRKATVKSTGMVEARLHRWPTMTQPSDTA